MELENVILSVVTQNQKDMHSVYSLISGYWPNMYRIPKIKSTELKNINKLKGPSDDAPIPLGKEKKAITSREGGRKS